MTSNLPSIQPYARHIFMCTGESCANQKDSQVLYAHLKERLRACGLDKGDKRIARSKSSCLGICEGGPLAVVYPEGVWYHSLDEQKLELILHEHLIKGKPVKEYVFHTKKSPE